MTAPAQVGIPGQTTEAVPPRSGPLRVVPQRAAARHPTGWRPSAPAAPAEEEAEEHRDQPAPQAEGAVTAASPAPGVAPAAGPPASAPPAAAGRSTEAPEPLG